MRGRVLLFVATLALLGLATVRAESADVEHICTTRFPSITQYFAWKDCVRTETQLQSELDLKQRIEDAKREREEAARPCLAADIPRMEALAARVRAAGKPEATLEEMQAALDAIIGEKSEIQIAKNDIKQRVLVNYIRTKCDSTFYFLINVREGGDKGLLWLRTWAENAPIGYKGELHSEFSFDFEEERSRERWRAENERMKSEQEAMFARLRREEEERRQKFLGSVKISNVKMKCYGSPSCSFRSVEFIVTNTSSTPVKSVGYGWMFLSPPKTECPANLATKHTEYLLVLQPGEKRQQTISITDVPDEANAKYCLAVTNLETPLPFR